MTIGPRGRHYAGPLVFLGLVVGLLTGCGGSDRLSKPEYEHKVRTLYAGVQASFRMTNVASLELLSKRVQAAQDELRHAADELEQIEPPKDVERQNEQLVAGMRQYAGELDEMRQAARNGDLRAVEAFNRENAENEAIERMAKAAEEMKFKGYDLGPISEE